jgi:hypothetical protein
MEEEWVAFDQASDRAVILAAWKANKISGAAAWELFTRHSLWGDKNEAFHRFAVGAEAISIQRELWGLAGPARGAAKRLIIMAYNHGFISMKAVDWLLDLFAAKME